MSELKCCKLCGAFLTCENKTECCPECQYFDEKDGICLAPDSFKKKAAKKSEPVELLDDIDDNDAFLFEDEDDEDEDDDISLLSDDDDLDLDDLGFEDDW